MTIADSAPRIEWFSHAELAASRGGFAPRDTQPSVSSFAAPPDGPRRATFDVADCDARLRAAGFTTLCYGAFELIGQQMLAAYLLRDFAPASFLRAYVEGRLFEVDPRFAEWRQGVSPIAWRLDELDAHARRTGERRMHALVNSLRAHAMHSGVIFCWPVPHLDLRVAVSLASEAHDGSLDDRVIGCALALSLDVHRAAQPHLDARVGGHARSCSSATRRRCSSGSCTGCPIRRSRTRSARRCIASARRSARSRSASTRATARSSPISRRGACAADEARIGCEWEDAAQQTCASYTKPLTAELIFHGKKMGAASRIN